MRRDTINRLKELRAQLDAPPSDAAAILILADVLDALIREDEVHQKQRQQFEELAREERAKMRPSKPPAPPPPPEPPFVLPQSVAHRLAALSRAIEAGELEQGSEET